MGGITKKIPLKQKAYHVIKEKIITCEYKPSSFLNEEFLSEELGMSRTPIRDALGRLEQERLVSILPKKGFFVSAITKEEIEMVFEGRLLLEPYFVEKYAHELTSKEIDNMEKIVDIYEKAIESEDSEAYYGLDNDFHQCIISKCSNHYLVSTYTALYNQDRRLRILVSKTVKQRLTETIIEKRAIIKCLRQGDVHGAAEEMREHIVKSKISMFTLI